MIKFEQSQALTSHFESFWSIVKSVRVNFLNFHTVHIMQPKTVKALLWLGPNIVKIVRLETEQ